ncbi:MAG TPA: sulfite exporter TauE/SafE family protein [Candidatus Cloacimonadota bacterium]|nr:sulfite exporter TauE/SafE family protein [Candidatus Cloacimonadota bacterium]
MQIVIFGMLIILMSALLQSLSGFGFSILAMPLITLVMAPQTAVPILLLSSFIVNISVLLTTSNAIDLRKIWVLLLAGIAGLPLGTHLLVILAGNILKIIIGFLIIIFGLLLLLGFRKELKHEKLAMLPIGLISGILGASLSISGPPIIIFLSNKQVGKNSFRGNLAIYFLLLNLVTIPIFWWNGLFTPEVLNYTGKFLPGLLLGVVLGNFLSRKVQEQHFRKFTLCLLLIMGVLAVVSGLK